MFARKLNGKKRQQQQAIFKSTFVTKISKLRTITICLMWLTEIERVCCLAWMKWIFVAEKFENENDRTNMCVRCNDLITNMKCREKKNNWTAISTSNGPTFGMNSWWLEKNMNLWHSNSEQLQNYSKKISQKIRFLWTGFILIRFNI